MPKRQEGTKRKASSIQPDDVMKKAKVETEEERTAREEKERQQEAREEERWRVAFREGKEHIPFAQPYRIHQHLRWFYSDMRRNRFPHGGQTVDNARCHHALMLQYNLYRFSMPQYLNEGGALGYMMRNEVMACRSGMGLRFSDVEKWYQHSKQTHWPDFEFYDETKPEDVEYVEEHHVKNQVFDALWKRPEHKFPKMAPMEINQVLDQKTREALWWDLPNGLLKDILSIIAEYIPLTDSLAQAQAQKYVPADPEANLYKVLLSAVLGDGLLILMEGQHQGDKHSPECALTPYDLVDAEVGTQITRQRPTCASWLPHGASYNLPRDKKCTIVIHHVQSEVKTVVVQEIEESRGQGGYWGEGDVLIQPGVRIQVTKIDKIKDFESFHTTCSAVRIRRGSVRIVHTLVSAA